MTKRKFARPSKKHDVDTRRRKHDDVISYYERRVQIQSI